MESFSAANQGRKETECDTCKATFWYIDPRPGGRPRKKCGVCSSRPPRYPWGFITSPDNQPGLSEMLQNISETSPDHGQHASVSAPKTSATDSISMDAYPMPSPTYPVLVAPESHNLKSLRTIATSTRAEPSMDESRIEQQLDDISRRLAELEMKVDSMRSQFIGRSDWVDMSARLDMVEHSMSETLGKVRGRLDSFSKEVRQIAVVPERELGEMFELIRMIRRYLDNS